MESNNSIPPEMRTTTAEVLRDLADVIENDEEDLWISEITNVKKRAPGIPGETWTIEGFTSRVKCSDGVKKIDLEIEAGPNGEGIFYD